MLFFKLFTIIIIFFERVYDGGVFLFKFILDEDNDDNNPFTIEELNDDDTKSPLQLAIVGRPNVGKSTLLNAILQEDRVLVGPEAGLTRDSIRVQFDYEGRTIYLVSINFWLLMASLSLLIHLLFTIWKKMCCFIYLIRSTSVTKPCVKHLAISTVLLIHVLS